MVTHHPQHTQHISCWLTILIPHNTYYGTILALATPVRYKRGKELKCSREGCQSPSPEVVCTLYLYRANGSQGMCTVCTLSLVVATILVNSGGHLYTFCLFFCLMFLYWKEFKKQDRNLPEDALDWTAVQLNWIALFDNLIDHIS